MAKYTSFNYLQFKDNYNKSDYFSTGEKIIMGILNITEDSFYDGGKYLQPKNIITQVKKMLDNGASIIDIGAQSTKPNAISKGPHEENKILLPTIKLLKNKFKNIFISVDTYWSEVAEKAIKSGGNMINDVSAGNIDSNMFGDDNEIDSEPIQETQETQQSQTFGPEGFNPPQASNRIIQSGKVDYYELMGYGSEESFNQAVGETQPTTNIYTSQQERLEEQIEVKNTQGLPEKEGGIVSLDALTLEQGMSAYEVKRGDTQEKIDNGFVMDGVEITNERVADDIREIQNLMNQEKMNHKMNSKIAVEPQEMSAQEIIDDMKSKANPTRGGQRVGEAPNKGGTTISVSDAELASLATSAFDIPGLAELQQAEANQAKANSKMNETAQKVPQEESNGLTPLTWDDAIGEGILSTTDVENEN